MEELNRFNGFPLARWANSDGVPVMESFPFPTLVSRKWRSTSPIRRSTITKRSFAEELKLLVERHGLKWHDETVETVEEL